MDTTRLVAGVLVWAAVSVAGNTQATVNEVQATSAGTVQSQAQASAPVVSGIAGPTPVRVDAPPVAAETVDGTSASPVTPPVETRDNAAATESAPAPATAPTAKVEPQVKPIKRAPAVKRAAPVAAKPAKSVAPPVRTPGNRIRGQVTLASSARQAVVASEVAETVVYFLPKAGAAKGDSSRFTISTHSKGFGPSVLVVPVGSTVSFPNRDSVLHNVVSSSPGQAFDLGTYPGGQVRSQRFGKAGLAVVNCNVHRSMRANVLVLETKYVTRPRADGSFTLEGVPDGAGTLVFWHPRAAAQSVAVTGPVTAPVRRTLVASRPRVGGQ